jgi:hypothetical protein
VNFVQLSAAQQYQNFEQLNTANPPHPVNNNRRKGRNRNNKTILVKAGTIPHKTNPLGATRTKGTKIPKGAITTNAKGGILLKPSTLVLFVACMVITPTIAPRSQISKR